MKVRDIGVKDVHCAPPTASLSEVAAMMKRHNVGIIPVCEANRLLGVLTDRDLVIGCMAAEMNPKACIAREFMTSNPVTATSDIDLRDAALIMSREQIHRLPIVDGQNLVGMVSLGDIALALAGEDSMVAQTLRRISTPTHALV